jgi:hypothetical protein
LEGLDVPNREGHGNKNTHNTEQEEQMELGLHWFALQEAVVILGEGKGERKERGEEREEGRGPYIHYRPFRAFSGSLKTHGGPEILRVPPEFAIITPVRFQNRS